MDHLDPGVKRMHMIALEARARLIWNETTAAQRCGYFAMGVGLETGLQVDDMADALAEDLDQADWAALQADADALHAAISRMAERLLVIRPFAPDALKGDWIDVLRDWIWGASLSAIGAKHAGLIEDTFTYRLVWALEALRVRRLSGGWEPEIGTIPGAAAACLDTGLPDYRMTLLVRGGLASREAAHIVINEHDPEFLDGRVMRQWLASDEIADLSLLEDWPSRSTAFLWRRFRDEVLSGEERAWRNSSESYAIVEMHGFRLPDRALLRVEPDFTGSHANLATPDFRIAGKLVSAIDVDSDAVMYAELDSDMAEVRVRRIGPDTLAGLV